MPTEKVQTKLFFFSCNGAATAFPSIEKATVAAEEYSIDRGYPCEAFLCEGCKSPLDGHRKPVSISFHIRQSQVPRDIPEEERWLPSRHRALRARIKEEQAARRAEVERVREEKLAAHRAVKEAEAAARRAAKEAEAAARRAVKVAATAREATTPSAKRPCRKMSAPKLSRKEQRDQWRAAGLCSRCGKTPTPGRKLCETCRVSCMNYTRNVRLRKATAVPAVTHVVDSQAQASVAA